MNTTTITAKQIEDQLRSDIGACNLLLELLDHEQSALAKKDSEALAKIIAQKLPALSQLEESAKQRAQWANMTSHGAPETWENFLSELNREKLKSDWELLKKLTHQCKEKNEVNGKILARNQQVYGRLLDLLRGQTAAPSLYNAYGSATSGARSYKVDEA